MSNYLLELGVIHIVLILAYWFFLRKERQHALMRFYLLGASVLALIIPLLKLPKLFYSQQPIEVVAIPLPLDGAVVNAASLTPADDVSLWSIDLLLWIYIGISAFFLIKFLTSVLYLIRLERKSKYEKFNELYIRRVQGIEGSFTFFNWIFLSDDIDKSHEDYSMILKHEKAHASLGHTYDLMFFELLQVCFWWLPTTWFVYKEIKKIHEYQADAYALKSYNIDQYSSILISSTLKSNGLSLASSFHDGLILKRLIAMKQKTKNVSPWKLGTLTALCALLFIAFACSEEVNNQTEDLVSPSADTPDELFTLVEEQPEFKGGMEEFYKYVAKEIKYPSQARRLGVEGQVNVEFTVQKDGTLADVKVTKGIGAGCDAEAIRVMENSPAFNPGRQRGKAVNVRMEVPINFKLDRTKTNADQTSYGVVAIDEAEVLKDKFNVDAKYVNGEWSGTVYGNEGERLPGVNIVVAGTSAGTVSDLDGTFSIKATKSQNLHLSFIGYESVSLKGK